jgi:SAM-dependent methyltransferase
MNLTETDKEYLRKYHRVFPNKEEAEQYLEESWGRNAIVMLWLDELRLHGVHDVLELGSNPYFLSLLIQKYFSFNLQLANYFGDPSRNGLQNDPMEIEGQTHEFIYQHFNIEKDRFPYPDSTFDVVIFCEIIEHLLMSPDWPVSEINRILKPDGFILISTPNAVRLANIAHLVRGRNIYPGYSPHGPYGRHNREYTMDELKDLLRDHGFEVTKAEIIDLHPHSWKRRVAKVIGPESWRDHLFVMGRKKQQDKH